MIVSLVIFRAGKLSYQIALSTTQYLDKETDYAVWRTAISNLNYMNKVLSSRPDYNLFRVCCLFASAQAFCNNDNTLSTDLYIKPTDTHQYLLSTSAHPKHTKQSIPYSLALRLRRICSEDETFKYRTRQLLEYLTKRGYKPKQTNKQIQKAAKKTRQDCLKTTKPRTNHRTPFVVTYHPALPQLSTILKQNLDILQRSLP